MSLHHARNTPGSANSHEPLPIPGRSCAPLTREIVHNYLNAQLTLLSRMEQGILDQFHALHFKDRELFAAGFARKNDPLILQELLTRVAHHRSLGAPCHVIEIAAGRTYCPNFYTGAPWLARTIATMFPNAAVTASDADNSLMAVWVTRDGTLDALPLPYLRPESLPKLLQQIPALHSPPKPLSDFSILENLPDLTTTFRQRIEHRMNRMLTSEDAVYIRPSLDAAVEESLSPLKILADTNYRTIGSRFPRQADFIMGRFLYSPPSRDDVDIVRRGIEPALTPSGAALVCFDSSPALGGEQINLSCGTPLASSTEARVWAEGVAQSTPMLTELLAIDTPAPIQEAAINLIGIHEIDTPEIRAALRRISIQQDFPFARRAVDAEVFLAKFEQRPNRWGF